MVTSSSNLTSPDGARAAIEARHLTQAEAAKLMGYSRSALNRFLNGKSALSIRMARALEGAFGNPKPRSMVVIPPLTIVTQAPPPRERRSFIKQVLAGGIGNAAAWFLLPLIP